jgi:hypothetical protein
MSTVAESVNPFAHLASAIGGPNPSGKYLRDDVAVIVEIQKARADILAERETWLGARRTEIRDLKDAVAAEVATGKMNSRYQGMLSEDRFNVSWGDVMSRCDRALAESKDLRLLVWLTEAYSYASGFPGAADGLTLTAALLKQYWSTIHPALGDLPESEYLDERRTWLQRFDDRGGGLPAIMRDTRLAQAAKPEEPEITLEHFIQAPNKRAGWPTAQQLDDAMRATPAEELATILAGIMRALSAADQFNAVARECLNDTSDFVRNLKSYLEQCRIVVAKYAPAIGDIPKDSLELQRAAAEPVLVSFQTRFIEVQRQIRGARCNRQEFLLEMEAADLCLAEGLYLLAIPILTKLVDTVDRRKLKEWEEPEIFTRLSACIDRCVNAAGDAAVASGVDALKQRTASLFPPETA